ncbi:hypothetical protein B0I21_11537 [Sphingobacterium paludis]|uniref:Uncharacterized protein n=1 Tax=Sphingobacterium paludis TaxID=1476465 RepID=A0A4R7CRI5_9SPHI|nr:hypothetical protein B0I21_11537 [Sphingobacterium paludis]
MAKEFTNDPFFSKIMSRGKLTISNDHFKKDLLNRIEYKNWKDKYFAKHRVFSILFFVLGISLGCWKFDFLTESVQHTLNISFYQTVLLAQTFIVLFILFQVNSILKLIFNT